jgi:hypothetical protein
MQAALYLPIFVSMGAYELVSIYVADFYMLEDFKLPSAMFRHDSSVDSLTLIFGVFRLVSAFEDFIWGSKWSYCWFYIVNF